MDFFLLVLKLRIGKEGNGVIAALDPLYIFNGVLSLNDLLNSLDLYKLYHVMEDEGVFNSLSLPMGSNHGL